MCTRGYILDAQAMYQATKVIALRGEAPTAGSTARSRPPTIVLRYDSTSGSDLMSMVPSMRIPILRQKYSYLPALAQ